MERERGGDGEGERMTQAEYNFINHSSSFRLSLFLLFFLS